MLLACHNVRHAVSLSKNQMQPSDKPNKKELSPEKVRKVAEKVYAMFLKDMKIAHERSGHNNKTSRVNRPAVYGRTY